MMINPQLLELPMSRINFHGPKDIRAIAVLMHFIQEVNILGLRVGKINEKHRSRILGDFHHLPPLDGTSKLRIFVLFVTENRTDSSYFLRKIRKLFLNVVR